MSRKPQDLLYAKSHEWVDVVREGADAIATVGISAFAIEQLTDLVYMDLPKPGKRVAVGDEFGEVESVKAVSPLYSPVAGEIVAVHSDLPGKLDDLKEDPYEFGWVIKVKLSGDGSIGHLMDYETYRQQCGESA